MYQALLTLRRSHPAWRLLTAETGPFVIGFLHHCFIEPNVRSRGRQDLQSQFEEYRAHIHDRLDEDAFPRPAAEYLDEWARDDRGWLRKYYVEDSDEPHYDITPATEKAIRWAIGLQQRSFVGTESRLLTIFELLRQIVEGAEADPNKRIEELQKRRAEIDAEIARVRAGDIELMDPTQIKDRFLQLAATARELLADFREVEQNFRDLDRAVRERIATFEGGKGELLEEVFGRRDAIRDSDQGKTFHAFWDFLMDPARQEELTSRLERVLALDSVRELRPDRRLKRVHHDWLEAGEVALRTVARLSQQLRRYLDERGWIEKRRIMQILRDIEQHALAVRAATPEGEHMSIDDLAPSIELSMERPLFSPARKSRIADCAVLDGKDDIDHTALFDQIYVDKEKLAGHVRHALQARDQVTLVEVVAEHPLELGLAEIVAYFDLASNDPGAVIDESRNEQLSWVDASGRRRVATFPSILFARPTRRSA